MSAGLLLFLFIFILLTIFAVLAGRDPTISFTLKRLVLSTQVMTITTIGDFVLASLAECSRSLRHGGLNSSLALHPVCKRILAVLDDGLRCLVSVICSTRLAWCDWGIVDELKEVLAEASDDGGLLAVLSQRIELVGECSLELLTRDVAQLRLSNERFGLGSDEFLLEYDNSWGVGVLVFQLGDLVCDLLLAVSRGLDGGFNVTNRLNSHAVLVVSVHELIFEFTNFVNEDAELVSYVGNIVVAGFTP